MARHCSSRLTWLLVLMTGLAVSIAGCTAVPPKPPPLVLAFKPGQVTTYHLVTGWHREVVVRSTVKGQVTEVPGGDTGSYVEMTYSQSVRGLDPNGRALLDIRIKDLNVYAKQVGDTIIDFNSASVEDANKPLARLIGQGYQIALTPNGQVVRILNVDTARSAVGSDGASQQVKAAARLLSDEAIRERHTVSALAYSGGGTDPSGKSWSQIQTVSFDNLGSKSFEKVYTFEGLEKADGRSVAVIDMHGVLSSKGAEQAHQTEDQAKAFAPMLDMTFIYTGQCRLDVTSRQVEQSHEKLEVQWVALDPAAKTGSNEGEPNSFLMKSTHLYQLERVAQAQAVTSQPPVKPQKPLSQGQGKARFALRFQEGQALEYRFTSHRDVQIQWDPNRAAVRPDPNNPSTMTESLELVMGYKSLKVDPDGLTKIEATFKSVTAKRSRLGGELYSRPDAVEALKDKAFTLVVEPGGKIRDANSLDSLLKEIGRLAFRGDPRKGPIKDPEMISDVVATQWFLWDAIASMDPTGVAVGQTWNSRLSLPTPMVMRKARDVWYTLEDIQQTPSGRVAVMGSTYKLSDQPAPASWPIPYSGRFRASGPFGMLGGYTFLDFEGRGQERFNLDSGIWEGSEQQFQMEMQAALPPPVAIMMRSKSESRPKVVIRQILKVERVK